VKIISVVGARPNFIKIAPFIRAIERHNAGKGPKVEHILVHTGQHYDHQMSQKFFDDLGIPAADIHLGVGSGTHAEQVGRTMIEFEKVVMAGKPDWVVVLGDVNATLACSVTAKKLQVKCCHIEAGVRSGDRTMPEEINRLVTDRLSDLLLAPDQFAVRNLKGEGVPEGKIRLVGNIMADTLVEQRGAAARLPIPGILKENLLLKDAPVPGIREGQYAVMTLHRPSNVDHREVFAPLAGFIAGEVAADMPVLWPVHPRARKQLELFGLWDRVASAPGLVLMRPLGYHEMLRLVMTARMLLTDSGGMQGESLVLGIDCLVLRENTEWTVALKEHGGSCLLVGNRADQVREGYRAALKERFKGRVPEYWDGKTAGRCLEAILTSSACAASPS